MIFRILSGWLRKPGKDRAIPAPGERWVSVDLPDLGRFEFCLHKQGDIWISDVIERGDVFDGHILKMMKALIEKGDTFVDVGANIGWFSVIGSRLVAENGRVFAFEPGPENLRLMARSVARNDCRNLTTFDVALGAARKQARLFLCEDNQGDHRLAEDPLGRDSVEVAVRPFDDFLPTVLRRDDPGAVFVKIDTQGSETAVLAGMRGLLGCGRRLRIVLEFWPHGLESCGSSAQALLDELSRQTWNIWLIYPGGEVEEIAIERLAELSRTLYAASTGSFADILLLSEDDDTGQRVLRALSSQS